MPTNSLKLYPSKVGSNYPPIECRFNYFKEENKVDAWEMIIKVIS